MLTFIWQQKNILKMLCGWCKSCSFSYNFLPGYSCGKKENILVVNSKTFKVVPTCSQLLGIVQDEPPNLQFTEQFTFSSLRLSFSSLFSIVSSSSSTMPSPWYLSCVHFGLLPDFLKLKRPLPRWKVPRPLPLLAQ